MNVIGHNDEGVHVNSSVLLEETMVIDQRTGFLWENESILRAKGDEVCGSRIFDVRKVSP